MSTQIEQVEGRRGVASFVDAAWAVQGGRPTPWVPPLRAMVRDALDHRGNPFYREAERALFVARRGREVLGRVAAVENRWHNQHHGDRVGFFGFFECVDDDDAARELLARASEWVRSRGLTSIRGPMSPSMNHECGLLVDGFDTPPVLMTPWNPGYYGDLVEGAGFQKVQDLLAFYIPAGDKLAVPERVRRLAERTLQRTRIKFRTLDVATLEQEARKVLQLYNEAWAGNWGFVPPSWEEFWHTAKDLKAVLAAEFSFVAEVDNEIVGFMLIARDINRLLREMPSGRLWPGNVIRLLTGTSKIMSGRVVLLGLRTEYRNRGLFPLVAYEAARRALEIRAEGAEASWILDDNEALVVPLEAMGLAPYKRWRIYEKSL